MDEEKKIKMNGNLSLKEKMENILNLLSASNSKELLEEASKNAEIEIENFEDAIEFDCEKLNNPITI